MRLNEIIILFKVIYLFILLSAIKSLLTTCYILSFLSLMLNFLRALIVYSIPNCPHMQLGMAGGLETLCGQTYGAEEYHKFGNYTCCAIISLILICFPVSILWTYMEKLLIFSGQDPSISQVAGKYSICLIPALFGYAVLQSLVRYFQAQSLILPMLISSCSVLCLHVPLCWVLTFTLQLGNAGAALAIGISYWLNVVFLGFYMKYSLSCEKTRVRFTKEAFIHIREFIRLAIPSALMLW